MAIDTLMTHASSAMTVVSLATFVGILWWSFSARRRDDFAEAERIPFADDFVDQAMAARQAPTGTAAADAQAGKERGHV